MLSLPVFTRWRKAPDPVVRVPHPSFFPADETHPSSLRAPCGWLLIAASVAFLLPLLPSARADVQEAKQRGNIPAKLVRNAPASPVPSSAEIDVGERVEITLEAHGGGGRSIEFDFATQPQHGQLTGFHQTSRNTAVVTYVHDAGSGPGQDHFTYRVQARGLAISGSVPVDIEIHEFPPRLVASPAELDFGAVNVGQTAHAQLTLRNDGGGTAVGRLEPPDPWTVEGSPEFRLRTGENQVFRLIFQPPKGRSFSETFRVGDYGGTRQRPANLHLLGTGVGVDIPERQFAGINGAPPLPLETNQPARLPDHLPAAAGEPVAPSSGAASRMPGEPRISADAPHRLNEGTNSNGAGNGTFTGPGFEAPQVVLNEAGVKTLKERSHGRTNLELTWQQPVPPPSKYRVEVRYLSLDRDDTLQIDWQPYAKVEYQVKNGQVTASLRDLPAGTNQSIRVVAVDHQNRLALPSSILQVQMDPALHWWKLSLLQWMLLLLVILGALVARRHWEDRQILHQIDIDRVKRQRAEA